MSDASKITNGTVRKVVLCEGCGRNYEYEMSRTAIGKHSSPEASRQEAEEYAARDAAEKLKQQLETECDVVACPSCGAITVAMRAHRKKFFVAAFSALGVGAGLTLVVFALWLFLGRIYIFAGVLSIGCFLVGCLLLLLRSKEMLLPRRGVA